MQNNKNLDTVTFDNLLLDVDSEQLHQKTRIRHQLRVDKHNQSSTNSIFLISFLMS